VSNSATALDEMAMIPREGCRARGRVVTLRDHPREEPDALRHLGAVVVEGK
jgi:hypothetical protein